MKAITLFNQWVDLGKDHGMELNHAHSVDYMISLIPDKISNKKFSFLDIGCGNGWVVKHFSKVNNCTLSVGVDGAKKMIEKAILRDKKSIYLNLNINNLDNYTNTFDVVFSMEVFYYLKDPKSVIEYVFKHLLNPGGFFILGIDHYLENSTSLSWPNDLNVDMKTYSMVQWKKMFENTGFSNISISQNGKKKNWEGTLVLSGSKY